MKLELGPERREGTQQMRPGVEERSKKQDQHGQTTKAGERLATDLKPLWLESGGCLSSYFKESDNT